MVTTSDRGAPRANAKSEATERTEGIGFCEVDKRMRFRSQVEMVVVRKSLAGFLQLTKSLLEGRLTAAGWDLRAMNVRTGHSSLKLSFLRIQSDLTMRRPARSSFGATTLITKSP